MDGMGTTMKLYRRGRWSQYQLLLANEHIKPYLLKTELFNEHSFYRNLHQHLSFKPCFGQMDITISKVYGSEDQFRIIEGDCLVKATLRGKAEVLRYLNEVSKPDQFYILQDIDFLYANNNHVLRFMVTVQRDIDAIWRVTDILEKNNLIDEKVLANTCSNINEIAIKTAVCLTENEAACSTVVLDIGILDKNIWIRDFELHHSKSKWSQYQLLSSIDELLPYIPKTEIATSYTFFDFIQTYKQVMLKPCFGQWGIGVAQVSWLKEELFEVHNERTKLLVEGGKEIIDYLQSHYLSKEKYIIQERVDLALIDDCIFDSRVMVQRDNQESKWEITAKVAKIATPNYIVSNVAKSILPLEEAFQQSTLSQNNKKLQSTVDKVCLLSAFNLGVHYPSITSIGIDIGIDKQGDIWLFETNLVPDFSLFKRLEDKSIYEKIMKKRTTRN